MHRDPFPYESNVSLLSRLLVPDPIGAGAWAAAVAAWRAAAGGGSLLEWLARHGVAGEAELLTVLATATGAAVEWEGRPDPEGGAEADLLRRQGMLPLAGRRGRRRVAGGAELAPDLGRLLGRAARDWEWVLITPLRAAEPARAEEGRVEGESAAEGWLRDILQAAAALGAADLHFERTGAELTVRARVKRDMVRVGCWRGGLGAAGLCLLKRRAGLSTAPAPLPQDGRLEILLAQGAVLFRAAHLATVDGESLVLRRLCAEDAGDGLAALGVPDELAAALRDCVRHEPGMVLFTGPTCSGKTTTLYGLLAGLAGEPLRVLTIEDPVEHELAHATQSTVAADRGWTFDAAVRAYLRQDPDLIVIGEIRDAESAEAGCRAALTGHGVLATLHARGEEEALDRLRHWGIAPGILAESVRLVVNQRLEPVAGGLRAVFSWLRPEPAELYRFFRSPERPFSWSGPGARQRSAAPASTTRRP